MRMRKKPWAKPYLETHTEYCLPSPEENKGNWKNLFHCELLHLELGMGKGDYLMQMAQLYPEIGWVGVEKDISCAAVACRKVEEKEPFDITNKRMICGDAANLTEWFVEGEVDVIHLNFSDPWPKKYTHKRRLSSQSFLDKYKTVLKKDGEIQMKTDNASLFEDSVLYFLENNFKIVDISVNYRRNEHPEDAITEYEHRFMEQGMPIYRLVAKPIW